MRIDVHVDRLVVGEALGPRARAALLAAVRDELARSLSAPEDAARGDGGDAARIADAVRAALPGSVTSRAAGLQVGTVEAGEGTP